MAYIKLDDGASPGNTVSPFIKSILHMWNCMVWMFTLDHFCMYSLTRSKQKNDIREAYLAASS